MKRLLALLLVLMMIIASSALATELEELSKEDLIAMIEELQGETPEESAEAPVEEPVEVEYVELAKGSKGEDVKALQQRLKDLGYLSGAVDGDYGGGTASAVSGFQNEAKLPVTGKADVATQEKLFAEDAPKAKVYENLDYKGVSRNPSDYMGRNVKFNGKVLQVMEDEEGLVSFRIATKGNYDDVVYVSMLLPENYSRILEDDKVTVTGMYFDLMSYKAVRGNTITIPWVWADLVALR